MRNRLFLYLVNVLQVPKHLYLVGFEHRECSRTLSFEKRCRMHWSTSQMDIWSSSYDHLRSVGRSVAWPLGRSLNRSLDRSIDRSIARSLDRSLARPLARSRDRSLDRSSISAVRFCHRRCSRELFKKFDIRLKFLRN